MKKISFNLLGIALTMLSLNACTNETPEPIQKEQNDSSLECIFSAKGFPRDFNDASRTSIAPQENSATFSWTEGDIIGVLPDEGAQVYFTIKDIDPENTDKATFTGGAWGLKSDNDYAAYYPFIKDIMLDRTKVPVDYTGQVHKEMVTVGQTVIQNLAPFDYMAAKSIRQESENLNFQFSHLGALVEVKFKVPTAGPVNRFILTSSEAVLPVKGTFDLTASTVAITSTAEEKAYSLAVNVEGLTTTSNNQEVSVFFMIPPMPNVNTNTLGATVLYGENNSSLPLNIKTEKYLEAGKYYTLETEVANELPEYIEITTSDGNGFGYTGYNNPIFKALYTLGGSKLRFIAESSVVTENVVLTGANNVNAYAIRNGDWLEVHTIAKKYKLPGDSKYMFRSIYDDEYNTPVFSKLTEIDLRKFDTSGVKYMDHMFASCFALTSLDLSNFDTSNVESMNGMFANCFINASAVSLDLSNFNTSKVTSMERMFAKSKISTVNLSSFNTSEVYHMQEMFSGCYSLTSLDLSKFDTSKVTDMEDMFHGCSGLTSLDLSKFNTSIVGNMTGMFSDCRNLTSLDVSTFNTTNVQFMEEMFSGCSSLASLDLSSFEFNHTGKGTKAECTNIFLNTITNDKKIFVSSAGKTYLDGLGSDITRLSHAITLTVK